MKIKEPRTELLALFCLAAFCLFLAIFLIACEDSGPVAPTDAQQADTVYIYPQTWVGIEFTFAGEPLNNDVRAKVASGWICNDPLLELPYWFPTNQELSAWALVHANFYICYAPVPGIPWAAAATMPLPDILPSLQEKLSADPRP